VRALREWRAALLQVFRRRFRYGEISFAVRRIIGAVLFGCLFFGTVVTRGTFEKRRVTT